MNAGKTNCESCAISLVLRLAMASLFIAAVVPKYMGGFESLVTNFETTFKASWLPMPLVTLQARLLPYIETLIPLWLLAGYRLRLGWFVTGVFLVSLAFGMLVLQQGAVAATNYFYVLLACVGLYFSPFDRLSVDGFLRKKAEA